MRPKRHIAIVGAGKVGTAVGVLLSRAGYEIAALSSRRQAHADAAAALTGGRALLDPVEAARLGDVIFITTPDDALADVCAEIADGGGFSPEDAVFHMSGAATTDVLGPARRAGARVGSIHPMQSFADPDGAIDQLPGSVFGVTAEPEALPVALEIVEALGGTPARITDEQKALYHAAACIVSNYTVALADAAEELYSAIGVDADLARRAYGPLLAGTQSNLARRGPSDALTGPIARGDASTVRRHLEALESAGIDTGLYRILGARTVAIARRRDSLSQQKADELLALLENEGPQELRCRGGGT